MEELKGIQILGASVQVILDGFGSFTLLASKILLESGLGTMDADGVGMAVLDANKWYPLDSFLSAFQRIGGEFGDFTLKQAGIHINKKAALPGDIMKDILTAFGALDFGYHFNHAKNGQPMFNPQAGTMEEGIGHFRVTPVAGKKQLTVTVDGPYPCAFDEGIVIGMAQRFDAMARIVHDTKGCRKRGAPACTYQVSWK